MKRIYMCSRVGADAVRLNAKAAAYLRRKGYHVFAPHEAAHNEVRFGVHASDDVIYAGDMAEMVQADACVMVGRIGVDCAFEAGWFQGMGVPTVWYTPPSSPGGWHPMLYRVPRVKELIQVLRFLKTFLREVA
jgi:nucleoside 2-deoxyribosyltransferase